MQIPQWIVIIPPFITFACALITKKIGRSLLLGIFFAAFIFGRFSLDIAITITTARLWANTQLYELFTWTGTFNNIYIYGFLFIIGIITALINATGGTQAYAKKIKQYIHSKKKAEFASLFLSLFLFLDDYLSCLTVGCVMRPLTDHFKIPRVKLAFLIDSLAAPFIIMVPVSSWVAVTCNQLQKSGISDTSSASLVFADQFYVYLLTIPFLFYSIILIINTWFIIDQRISFGTIKKHESLAEKTGNLFGGKNPPTTTVTQCAHEKNPSLIDFMLPICLLVGLVIFGLLYQGGFFSENKTFVKALQNADSFPVLFFASLTSLLISVAVATVRKRITLSTLPRIIYDGIKLMAPAIVILILAWTFSDLLTHYLHTGDYLAYLLSGSLPIVLFPLIFYLLTALIATMLGSSWATMFIMIPIAIPMLVTCTHLPPPLVLYQIPLLIPTLGAILSGAVTGDHLSPIASTTIMATTSTGTHLIDHVQTQLAYSWPTVLGTALAFLLAGLTVTWERLSSLTVSLGIGIAVSITILLLFNYRAQKKKKIAK